MTNLGVRALGSVIVCASLAGCRSGGPYFAFIDKAGHTRIRLEPGQDARSFSEGLAAVSLNRKWGYIDAGGGYVIAPRFGDASEFSEGLALATTAPEEEYWERTTLFGYIDKTGEFVIPAQYHWARSFSDGVAPVCTGPCRNQDLPNARVGYIDRGGKYMIAPQYRSGSRFSEGRAWVSDTYGVFARQQLIDSSGKIVRTSPFTLAQEFSHGLAATHRGFVNTEGEIVFSWEIATNEEGFSDGWAAVFEGKRVVFIDTKGNVVLRPSYESVGC
jgi:hypothetical protein